MSVPQFHMRSDSSQIGGRFGEVVRIMTAVFGLALLVVLLVVIMRDGTALGTVKKSGVMHSDVRLVGEGDARHFVFTHIDSLEFGSGPIPALGDTVLKVGDSTATPAYWGATINAPMPPDTQIFLTYRGALGDKTALITARNMERLTYAMLLIIEWLRYLVALGFVGVGLWAFFAQPNSRQVRAFAWFCFSMTSLMIAGVSAISDNYATFSVPGWGYVESVLQAIFAAFGSYWLSLQLLFPHPVRLLRRFPVPVYLVAFLPLLLYLTGEIGEGLGLLGKDLADSSRNLGAIGSVVALVIGFVISAVRLARKKDRVEKRQLSIVLWGTVLGLGCMIGLIFTMQLFREWFDAAPMRTLIGVNIAFALLLLTPISYAYAFGRYRLLEVQSRIRRGTRYVLTTVLVFALLLAVVYAIGEYALGQFGIRGNLPTMAIAIVLALGIGPARRKLQSTIEQRYYPERQRLRDTLQHFLDRTASFANQHSFWIQLEERIRDSLGVDTVHPVLAGNGGGFHLRELQATPFHCQSDFVLNLGKVRRPLFVDEMIASGRTAISDDELDWLSSNGVALVLPLMAQQKLTGFLAIGYKNENEDYAAEEITVLSSLAPQVALAAENLRLAEENIEKRRLEEQMQMARRIQEGFLPRELPVTPGLVCAAHSRFSLEVAGDYYDLIPLEGNRTVLAIADVSGKGAGAALLMANLQASLRTAVEIGIPLSRAVERVNELIHRNTPPEQYITFVAAIFDPAHNELTYVNAGHNPPFIIRASGHIDELPATGLILGALPGMKYEQDTMRLFEGDTLVMFTDGVSEPMNSGDEEFGEPRIRELVAQCRTCSPAELIERIESAVNSFCGRVPYEDDSTLLVVRRV
ncbi:SpoIIE family protein phosphatase [bacterium]|nr:SpoIIE family protein phosphatase [bacterium]